MHKFIFVGALLVLTLSKVQAQEQSKAPAIASAEKVKADRLKILLDEQAEITEKLILATKTEPKNSEKIHRLNEDLKAISREVAAVKGSKAVEIKLISREVTPEIADKKSDFQQPSNMVFESWDVFKKFGKKGN